MPLISSTSWNFDADRGRQEPYSALFETFQVSTLAELPSWQRRGHNSVLSQALHKRIVKIHAIVKVFDSQPLVFAVRPVIVDVGEHSRHAIGGNAGDAQIFAVACSRIHHGHDWEPAIELCAEIFQFLHDSRVDRRGWRRYGFSCNADGNPVVSQHSL